MLSQLKIPLTFQMQCCFCHSSINKDWKPKVERQGLRCNHCGKLNEHDWTEHDFNKNTEYYRMISEEQP